MLTLFVVKQCDDDGIFDQTTRITDENARITDEKGLIVLHQYDVHKHDRLFRTKVVYLVWIIESA